MRKHSDINFNYTYRFHLVLLEFYFEKNVIYPEVQAARITEFHTEN